MAQQTDIQKWQFILLEQRRANTKRWIDKIEQAADKAALVNAEYENILRALEATLTLPDGEKLAYQLIQLLHPIVVEIADWVRWQNYLEQLLALLPDDAKYSRATLFVQRGDIRARLGNFSDAESDYQKGIAIFDAFTHHEESAFAKGRLATVFAKKGEYQAAIALCEEAIEVAKSLDDIALHSQLELNKSFIYFHNQDYQKSLSSADFAYDNFRALGLQQEAARALSNIVAISNELGEWGKVIEQTKLLIEDLQDSADLTSLSKLKTTLGVAAFKSGNFPLAESNWHQALLLYTQMNDKAGMAGSYNNLGLVYTMLEESAEAQKMYQNAVKTYDDIGDPFYKANALDNLADLHARQGDFEAGYDALQSAIVELKRIEDMPQVPQLIAGMEKKLHEFQEKRD